MILPLASNHAPSTATRIVMRRAAGVGHLAGHGPLPDQVVEPELVGAEHVAQGLGQGEGMARRPDRLVGLLGILDRRLIGPRPIGQIFLAVLAGDDLPRRLHGHGGQVRRVGAHVGDVPVLVQALGHLHGPPRGEAVLAVGFLLQGAGGERRIGPRGVGFVLQLGDAGRAAAAVAEPGSQLARPAAG